MGKNKLKKFADMAAMERVYQYPFAALKEGGFPLRGRWGEEVFGNGNPIVLELGCGKGEYTVGLGRRFPGKNFIGIDIKGARMWTGAKAAEAEGLGNVAFLRTSIELLESFFAPGEVSEVWITFPDPQMKKERKRLTGTRMIELYRRVVRPGGTVNLKTDSPFLYNYTREMLAANGIAPQACCADIYGAEAPAESFPEGLTELRTYYEQQWLSRGMTIKYIAFGIPQEDVVLKEPEVEIEYDTYRAYPRHHAAPCSAACDSGASGASPATPL